MKKTITFVKILTLLFTLGFTSQQLTFAQDRNSTEIKLKDLPILKFNSKMGTFTANFNGVNVSPTTITNNLGEWLGTDNNHSFQFVKAVTDDIGFTHTTFQHFYKGVKVADEIILIHEKDGKLTFVNGELSKNINLDIKQLLLQSDVESIITADIDASNVNFTNFEQVITKVDNGKDVKTHLTTKLSAAALSSLKAFDYYVDNSTKQIVRKLSKIYDQNLLVNNLTPISSSAEESVSKVLVDTPSTSATYYKGNQPVTVDSYNGSYRLKDSAKNIHTRNGTGWDGSGNPSTGELTGTITEYTSATPNFTATDTKPAVEVHWAMSKAKDYYVTRHNRNSYDNNGSIIRNYYNINFGSAAQPNGMNAAAIDMSGIVAMVYGNGTLKQADGTTLQGMYPVVGLDVAGHEYSHLMVSRTANLAYEAESGALNESFADMFGAAIEFYTNSSPNWTIGEGILNPSYFSPTYMRSMSAPKSAPTQNGMVAQPDTYGGQFWIVPTPPYNQSNDNGGVHINSGVGNKWFYLLSAGGSGTNDLGNAYNVTAITIQKSEKIAYRLLANYLTANSQYNDAFVLSQQAVTDLYGASGNEQTQNMKAWYAVGFGNGLLGVSDVANTKIDNQFNVYPNPVNNGVFTIESNLKDDAKFDIFDASGKLIKQGDKLQKGENKINISGVTSGVYLLKINAEGQTLTKKLIVK